MTLFVVLAALMAALAAAVVTLPLLRDRQHRIFGVVAGLCVAAVSAGLYPLWSTWDWHTPTVAPAASADVAAMVSKLEQRLRDQPNDLTGWLMLGRSYVTLQRLDDAIVAYDHAHRLDAGNAEATLGLGEAMSLRAGGNITPAAGQLFDEALQLAPRNPKALLYGGFAAAARGDFAAARTRWLALKALHPPEPIEQMLDARIAELGPGEGASAAATAATDSSSEVLVTVRVAPALKTRLTDTEPLFIFALEPGQRGPPLAAKRLTTAALGSQIKLSAADSMLPGRVLVGGRTVSITARVSFSGQPLPAAGDLYGETTYEVGHDGPRDLVIDRVAD